MANNRSGSNLFSIDPDAILEILQSANSTLKSRASVWIDGLREKIRDPGSLSTTEIQDLAKKTKELQLDVKSARLSDGSSFRDAVKLVENFHKPLEIQLSKATDHLSKVLRDKVIASRPVAPPQISRSPVTITSEGVIVVTSAPAKDFLPDLPLDWSVTSVDRANVDLEALRAYFTDNALLTAARGHLRATGQTDLPGVSYDTVARV